MNVHHEIQKYYIDIELNYYDLKGNEEHRKNI